MRSSVGGNHAPVIGPPAGSSDNNSGNGAAGPDVSQSQSEDSKHGLLLFLPQSPFDTMPIPSIRAGSFSDSADVGTPTVQQIQFSQDPSQANAAGVSVATGIASGAGMGRGTQSGPSELVMVPEFDHESGSDSSDEEAEPEDMPFAWAQPEDRTLDVVGEAATGGGNSVQPTANTSGASTGGTNAGGDSHGGQGGQGGHNLLMQMCLAPPTLTLCQNNDKHRHGTGFMNDGIGSSDVIVQSKLAEFARFRLNFGSRLVCLNEFGGTVVNGVPSASASVYNSAESEDAVDDPLHCLDSM